MSQDTGTSRGVELVTLVAVGAAVPSGRLAVADVAAGWDAKGGKGSLAVCGPDEDCLTLGWAAAELALGAAGEPPGAVGGLWWGTARPPMAEGPSHAFLATAIGLGHESSGLLASGSTHAGLDALVAAWDALVAGAVDVALVVASDALVPGAGTGAERATGAGAVALVLARRSGGPARLVRRATWVRPLLDRYRGDGQAGTGDPYDPRLYRERELLPSVAAAAGALGVVPQGARWSVPDPDGRLGKAVARAVGAASVSSEGVFGQIGDAGSAAPFLGLLGALEEPGAACAVGTGGGRSTAVLVEVESAVPGAAAGRGLLAGVKGTRPVSYASVLRARGQLVPLADPVPMGVPPGSAAFVRGNEELLGLLGSKCAACGTISVPPSIHPVCVQCGGAEGTLVKLARNGTVQTFVVNHTMPAPFEAPLPLAVVDLDDGARVMLQGLPEDAAVLAIGDRVHLELRRYALERGVPVYGFKVRRDASDEQTGNGSSPGRSAQGAEPAEAKAAERIRS
jgi:hydroxymethylglutaryl-CoA synthase